MGLSEENRSELEKSDDQDRAIFNLLTKETEQELRIYLKKVIEERNAKSGKIVDGSILKSLLDQNPVLGNSDFAAFCIDEDYDPECLNKLLKPLGLDINDSDLLNKIESSELNLLDPLYKDGSHRVASRCGEIQNSIYEVCNSASGGLRVSREDINSSFYSAMEDAQKENDKDRYSAIDAQRQIFVCASQDKKFNPSIYNLIHGKMKIATQEIKQYKLDKDSHLKKLGANIQSQSLFSSSTQLSDKEITRFANTMKERRLDRSNEKDSIESVIATTNTLKQSDENVEQIEHFENRQKDPSENHFWESEPSHFRNSLTPAQIDNLSEKADEKVKDLKSKIDPKEERLKRLEELLAERSKDKIDEKSDQTSSSNRELSELIKSLRGEISSLKSDLSKVQKEKDRLVSNNNVPVTEDNSLQGEQKNSPIETKHTSGQNDLAVSNSATPSSRTFLDPSGGALPSPKIETTRGLNNKKQVRVGQSGSYILGGFLTFNVQRSAEILKPENIEELYSILKERGEFQITNKDGELEIIRPIYKDGKIVGTKREVVEKTKKKVTKEKKKKVKVETKKDGQSAYYQYLKSLFAK